MNAEMDALIQQARNERKWLFCAYQDLWFSPDELVAEQAKGHFRWGVVNWQLRDPAEELTRLARAINDAAVQFERFRTRVNMSQATTTVS